MSSTRQHIRIHEYKTDIAQHHPKPRMNSLEKFWSQNFWDFFQKMKNDTHKVVVEGGFTGDRGRFFWKSWKILRRTWPNEPWKSPKTIRRTWLRYCTHPLTSLPRACFINFFTSIFVCRRERKRRIRGAYDWEFQWVDATGSRYWCCW